MALKDWGFAPGAGDDPTVDGPGGQPARLRRMFARRPNTGVISDVDSVREFIDELKNDPSIATPIGSALIGAHADNEGNIFLSMFPDQQQPNEFMYKGQTNFEVLVKTMDASRPERSINMDDVLDNSGNHFVHFKGCNIGKAPKFLKKFKEALDADQVTGPKFFHGIAWYEDAGIYEYMAYQFQVFQKDPFPTRTALIAAFTAGNFTLVDGTTTVPPSSWATWIPKKIKKKFSKSMTFALGQTAGGRKKLAIGREFRVESNRKHPFTWTMGTLSPFPAKSAYMSTLTTDITGAPEFQSNYGFPFHERWGYATPAAFIAGLRWTFTRGVKGDPNALVASGTRSQYTVLVPVTDVSSGNLVFNFYPNDSTVGPPVAQFTDTNPTYFTVL